MALFSARLPFNVVRSQVVGNNLIFTWQGGSALARGEKTNYEFYPVKEKSNNWNFFFFGSFLNRKVLFPPCALFLFLPVRED